MSGSRIIQDMEKTFGEGQLEDIREQEEEHRVPTRVDIDKMPDIEDSVAKIVESDPQVAGVQHDPQHGGEGRDFLLPDVLQQFTLVEENAENNLQERLKQVNDQEQIHEDFPPPQQDDDLLHGLPLKILIRSF